MATFLQLYNHEYSLAYEEQIEAGSAFDDVYFDGVYFWVTHNTSLSIKQYYFNGTSINLVATHTVTLSLTASQTFDGIKGITGDGLHIIVLVNITTFVAMVTTSAAHAAILDRSGNESLRFASLSSLIDTHYTIAYDGKHIIRTYSDGVTNNFRYYDKAERNVTRTITSGGLKRQVAFNGLMHRTGLVSGTTQGQTVDFDLTQAQANVATGITSKGFDFHNCDSMFAEFFSLGAEAVGPYTYSLRN